MKLSERMRHCILLGIAEDYMDVREWAVEAAKLESQNAELLAALAEACYLLYIAKEGLTPAWDKQSESTKQIWRDKAIHKAKGE